MRNNPDIVDGFRMRGREGTRLESFSDAVFAFALTLIVVSLEVPKSFADLIGVMRGFPAFALCFTLLATIWNTHYKFSRFHLQFWICWRLSRLHFALSTCLALA